MGGASKGRAPRRNGRPATHGVETVPTASLKFHPRNYRKHPDNQLEHIIASIRDHGFYRNVVVAKDDVILAGAGVVQAALKAGIESVPVIRLDLKSNERRALKVLTSDNEISRLAEIDDRALTELLKEIMGDDKSALLGTGFNQEQLAALAMVTRNSSELADFDAAKHWVGMPEHDTGTPPMSLTVFFYSQKDRTKFCAKAGVDVGKVREYRQGTLWTTQWPDQDRADAKAVKLVAS